MSTKEEAEERQQRIEQRRTKNYEIFASIETMARKLKSFQMKEKHKIQLKSN